MRTVVNDNNIRISTITHFLHKAVSLKVYVLSTYSFEIVPELYLVTLNLHFKGYTSSHKKKSNYVL